MISEDNSHISTEDRDFSDPVKWSDERIVEAIRLLEEVHLPQKAVGTDSWKEVTATLAQLRFEQNQREKDLDELNAELTQLLASTPAD